MTKLSNILTLLTDSHRKRVIVDHVPTNAVEVVEKSVNPRQANPVIRLVGRDRDTLLEDLVGRRRLESYWDASPNSPSNRWKLSFKQQFTVLYFREREKNDVIWYGVC